MEGSLQTGLKASGERVGNRGETERRPRGEGTRMLRHGWEEQEWTRTLGGVGRWGLTEEVFGRSTWRQMQTNRLWQGCWKPKNLIAFLSPLLSLSPSSQQRHIITSQSDTVLQFLKRQT